MARGLFSKRAAGIAAAAASIAALSPVVAAAPPPQQRQSCEMGKAENCAFAANELDEASLLATRGAVAKAHDNLADANDKAAKKGKATCNEVKYQGLCYRTCTDMGAMEPRRSVSKCGETHDYSYLQSCNEDGTAMTGAGAAPGIGGRPLGECFGDGSASEVSPEAPNMCTTDYQKGAPSAKAEGCKTKYYCTDGKSTPLVYKQGEELMCACPLGKDPPMKWMPKPNGVLQTSPVKGKGCNVGCQKAKAWLMHDNIAYCCPNSKQPTVKKQPGGGDYTVKCSCP